MRRRFSKFVSILFGCLLTCMFFQAHSVMAQESDQTTETSPESNLKTATFGGGCFWCIEAVFQQFDGVTSVVSGFSGGRVENPTYQQVMRGRTGHAEVVQVQFDPDKISFEKLLEIFWTAHDPTTKNRQGPDVGPQYRSIILFHDEAQKKAADEMKAKIDEAKIFNRKIVTEIVEYQAFYPAEDYHQNYFNNNPYQAYCQTMIAPKVAKIRELFANELKRR